MEIIELKAEPRSMTGKKGARACRNKGMLPGVFYGRGDEPTPLAVDPAQLNKVLRTQAGSNVIIKLTLDEKAEPVNVVVKELQVDSIKGTMRHVDFCHISLDRKIRSMVPFKIVGESPGVKEGGILEHILWELEIESLPLDIPGEIEVDISELNIGDQLNVSQMTVPEGVSVLSDWDMTVVHVVAPRIEVVEVPEEAELEGAEPEVISEGAEEESKAEKKEETKEAEEK